MNPSNTSPISWTRTLAAFSSILLGIAYMVYDNAFTGMRMRAEDILALSFFGAVVASPFILRLRFMAAQIFGRAILIQGALFCTLALINAMFMKDLSAKMTWEIVFGLCVVVWPLAVIGKRGLATDSKVFSPNAFRTTLIASLLLGLADTWALVFYSAMMEEVGPMLASAAVMSVALYGLYRMKVWGLGLCVTANVIIAAFAISGVFDLPDVLAYGLTATAVIQLLLPVPLMARVFRGLRRQALTSES